MPEFAPMQPPIARLAVFGIGLIGGSLALALKRNGSVREVLGVGRSAANLQLALQCGLIDRVVHDPLEAVAEADMVVLAVPVGQMGGLMRAVAPALRPGTLLTDAGSTKQDVVALMREHLPRHLPWCVPAHPIAGAELSGAAAARADLYHERNVVLTPLAESAPEAVGRVSALWAACGARISCMDAAAHDAIFAAVSHLPHVLAYALVHMLATRDNAAELFGFAASGFRDFTRIAASSPEMWRDIALANRTALLHELDAYQAQVAELRNAIDQQDGDALLAAFTCASLARQNWQSS